MPRKSQQVVINRPNYSAIEEMFEAALDIVENEDNKGNDAAYWDGVRQALGWVTGEYPDPPDEEAAVGPHEVQPATADVEEDEEYEEYERRVEKEATH
jgi:hypothetical protein